MELNAPGDDLLAFVKDKCGPSSSLCGCRWVGTPTNPSHKNVQRRPRRTCGKPLSNDTSFNWLVQRVLLNITEFLYSRFSEQLHRFVPIKLKLHVRPLLVQFSGSDTVNDYEIQATCASSVIPPLIDVHRAIMRILIRNLNSVNRMSSYAS